jgi:hypothetical protein
MAAPIVPKSEARKSDSVVVGFGELPAVKTDKGLCWALPGSGLICCPKAARKAAAKLDHMIQVNVQRTGRALI